MSLKWGFVHLLYYAKVMQTNFVLHELSPTFAEFSERTQMSQTFANVNENSDQRKIRLSVNAKKY